MRADTTAMKGAVAGALAGLVAAFVSKQFQLIWNTAQEAATGEKAEGGEAQDDPATIQLADRVAEAVEGDPVPEPLRESAGEFVHYLTGAGLGAAYGLLAESWPAVTSGRGAGYGLATNLALNDAIVPALGLAPPPSETPLVKHAYALASHLVFGLALERSRRALRALL